MRKLILFCLFVILTASSAQTEVLEELWNKYAPDNFREEAELPTPGAIYGRAIGAGESSFSYQWKYRPKTYEMHFQDPEKLARGIRSLALYAGDISPDLPPETFYKGVTGFHYSAAQIAGWLNNVIKNKEELNPEENIFAGEMLKDGVVRLGAQGFTPGKEISHALGSAPGKKRSFAKNLLHERLHVFWDEDKQMRDDARSAWGRMSASEKAEIRKRLKNYNQNNEEQLLEEWAILKAEQNEFNLK